MLAPFLLLVFNALLSKYAQARKRAMLVPFSSLRGSPTLGLTRQSIFDCKDLLHQCASRNDVLYFIHTAFKL